MFWLHVCLCAGVRSPKLDSRELMPCVCWCPSKIVLTAEPSFQSCFCSFLVHMLCRECVLSARLLQETRSSCNSGSVWLAACSKIHCWEWPLPACFLITVYTTMIHGAFHIFHLHCLISQLVWILWVEKALFIRIWTYNKKFSGKK